MRMAKNLIPKTPEQMPYEVKLQKMNTGHRVVLVDPNNNKLVMAGEIVVRRKDAHDVAIKVRDGWNDKRDTIKSEPIEVLPKGYKFSRNAGPVKKKAPKESLGLQQYRANIKKRGRKAFSLDAFTRAVLSNDTKTTKKMMDAHAAKRAAKKASPKAIQKAAQDVMAMLNKKK